MREDVRHKDALNMLGINHIVRLRGIMYKKEINNSNKIPKQFGLLYFIPGVMSTRTPLSFRIRLALLQHSYLDKDERGDMLNRINTFINIDCYLCQCVTDVFETFAG